MQQKPVFLNIFAIRFPLTAIISILHRVSGILLFLAIPILLYCLEQSLLSEEKFALIKHYFSLGIVKVFVLGVMGLFLYHMLAGIRHMLMDYGVGETKTSGKIGSQIVLISFVILFFIIGKWLW